MRTTESGNKRKKKSDFKSEEKMKHNEREEQDVIEVAIISLAWKNQPFDQNCFLKISWIM